MKPRAARAPLAAPQGGQRVAAHPRAVVVSIGALMGGAPSSDSQTPVSNAHHGRASRPRAAEEPQRATRATRSHRGLLELTRSRWERDYILTTPRSRWGRFYRRARQYYIASRRCRGASIYWRGTTQYISRLSRDAPKYRRDAPKYIDARANILTRPYIDVTRYNIDVRAYKSVPQ